MKQTITQSQFIDAFLNMGRENQFTYDGKVALYDYINQYDEDCGTETELDVIALCCEFTEYSDLEEFQNDYNAEDYPDMESVNDATMVIPVRGDSFIIQQF